MQKKGLLIISLVLVFAVLLGACAAPAEPAAEAPMVEEEKPELDDESPRGHIEIIRNFAAAIAGKEELLTPGEQGLYSVEFGNACTLSGQKKKPVNLAIDREEYEALMEELKKKSQPKKNVKVQRATDPKYRQ